MSFMSFLVLFLLSECNFEEHHLCGYSNSWNPNVNWYVGGSVARDPESNQLEHHNDNQRGKRRSQTFALKKQDVFMLSNKSEFLAKDKT